MTGLLRRAAAEFIGTAFLVMTVVGSGVMASRLSPDDVGLRLLQNSLATGAALVALIVALQPVSKGVESVRPIRDEIKTRIEALVESLTPATA